MRKIAFVIIIIILLLIINSLVFSIWDVWQQKDVVLQAQADLDLQKQENQRLKASLSYSQTPEFIEKEARDKLFMIREGEQRVIIPKDEKASEEQEIQDNDPNWKQWLNLFL